MVKKYNVLSNHLGRSNKFVYFDVVYKLLSLLEGGQLSDHLTLALVPGSCSGMFQLPTGEPTREYGIDSLTFISRR